MKRCQSCGTENSDDSQYCDECGAMQKNRPARDDNKPKIEAASLNRQISDAPVFQSSSGKTSIGISPSAQIAFEPESEEKFFAGNAEKSKGVHALLEVERGDLRGAKFSLVADESNIGRWDADNGIFPDVDLDKYDPEAKISRRHARIIRLKGGNYTVEDLGSTNGTFVNRGRRLIPGVKTALKDGDEIIVGKTFLRFHIGE